MWLEMQLNPSSPPQGAKPRRLKSHFIFLNVNIVASTNKSYFVSKVLLLALKQPGVPVLGLLEFFGLVPQNTIYLFKISYNQLAPTLANKEYE